MFTFPMTMMPNTDADDPWTPSDLGADLVFWADHESTYNAGVWENKGTGSDTTQISSSENPSRVSGVLNGNSVLRFDGSNDQLSLGTGWDYDEISIYIVAAPGVNITSGTSSTYGLIAGGSSSGRRLYMTFSFFGNQLNAFYTPASISYLTDINSGDFNLFEFKNNLVAPSSELLVNTNPIGTSNDTITKLFASDEMRLGRRFGSGWTDPFNGDIYSVVITRSILSTDDQDRLQGYLLWDAGLEALLPSGHPYKSAAP